MDEPEGELSCDAMFDGALRFHQRRRGYRFGIDAMLLGGGLRQLPGRRVLDLGCGCGVVGLVAACLHAEREVIGLEVQPGLAALARRNAADNAAAARVEILEADARQVGAWRARRRGQAGADLAQPPWADAITPGFELILVNPPFYTPGAGHQAPDDEKARARHLLHGNLGELLKAGRLLLTAQGVMRVIFPAERLVDLLAATAQAGLKARRLRAVHSFAGEDARLVLLDAATAGRRELVMAPPVVLFDAPGRYTAELQALLSGRALAL